MAAAVMATLLLAAVPPGLEASVIVKEANQSVELHCVAPFSWQACAVGHTQTQRECGIRRDDGHADCPEFGDDGYSIQSRWNGCSLLIDRLSQQDQGNWTCAFVRKRAEDTDVELEAGYWDHEAFIDLTVIEPPSYCEWEPVPAGTYYEIPYNYNETTVINVIVHNVRPAPKITWMMNNQSINGYHSTSSKVIEDFVALTVNESLLFSGKEDYDGQELQCLIEIYQIYEDETLNIVYSEKKTVNLRCIGCPKRSTSTIATTSTTATTTATTTVSTTKTPTTTTTTSTTPTTTTTTTTNA